MAIATSTAIILGISAAASAYGAHKKAQAAKEAAKTQVASAGAAKADLQPLYEQSVARLDPYAQLGTQAVGQLRALGGYPAPPPLPPGGSAARPQGPVPWNPADPATAGRPNPPMNMSDPRVQALARGGSLADFGAPAGRTQSSYGGSTGTAVPRQGGSFQTTGGGGGLVLMQAPDGEQREVPAQMVPQFEQAGARRL